MKQGKVALASIPIEKLRRGQYQPRQLFEQEPLEELAQSIRSAGLLQPLIVRLATNGHYEIVAGERRWRAAQLAGLSVIDCLIKDYSDEQAAQASAVENLNRVDLNPIEEATMYRDLVEKFTYTHDELAALVGRERSTITNVLRLLTLDERVQNLLRSGKLSEAHGKLLAGISKERQSMLATKVVEEEWSTRHLSKEIKKLNTLKVAQEKSKDPNVNKLERLLSDHMGCPVEIKQTDGRGELKIQFYNLDILESLFDKIGFKANM